MSLDGQHGEQVGTRTVLDAALRELTIDRRNADVPGPRSDQLVDGVLLDRVSNPPDTSAEGEEHERPSGRQREASRHDGETEIRTNRTAPREMSVSS